MFSKVFAKKESISIEELVKQGAIIIDVRSEDEFVRGHTKGARNIPASSLHLVSGVVKNKDAAIILCCASGARSAFAKKILESYGYTNVHNGGSWQTLARLLLK